MATVQSSLYMAGNIVSQVKKVNASIQSVTANMKRMKAAFKQFINLDNVLTQVELVRTRLQVLGDNIVLRFTVNDEDSLYKFNMMKNRMQNIFSQLFVPIKLDTGYILSQFNSLRTWLDSVLNASTVIKIQFALPMQEEMLTNEQNPVMKTDTGDAGIVTTFLDTFKNYIPYLLGIGAALQGVNSLVQLFGRIIVSTMATGATATFLATLAAHGLTVAWAGLNTAMKANIIIYIILLIIGLITWLINLWKTNDEFAAGFMRAWNSVLNFFDQVSIFFFKIGMAIVNSLFTMRVKALEIIESLINGVIDGINGLSSMANEILGTSFDIIGHVEMVSDAKAEADFIKKAQESALKILEESASRRAAEREQKVLEMLEDRAEKRMQMENEKKKQLDFNLEFENKWSGGQATSMSGIGANVGTNIGANIDRVGKVDQVGTIENTVDISSEDIKTMRELAEMKSIQNFVSLQPSVKVEGISVREEADINTIVARIEQKLEQEFYAAAEGVYM